MLRGLLAFSFACSLEKEKAQMNFWDPVGGRNNNLLKLERQRPDYTANYTELVMRALKVEQQLSLLVLAQGRRNKWPKTTTTNELVCWPRLAVCKTTFQKLSQNEIIFLSSSAANGFFSVQREVWLLPCKIHLSGFPVSSSSSKKL